MGNYLYLVMVIIYLSTWCNPINGGKRCTKKDMDALGMKLDNCCKIEKADIQDCSSLPNFTGVTKITPDGHQSIDVYCRAGWTYIARRFDGSENFTQPWETYQEGFGNVGGEHFIGLENLVAILRQGHYRLRIVLTTWPGPAKTTGYAEYSTFMIGEESDKYRLTIGGFSGDAGDSLGLEHNGNQFSTYDNDNDGLMGENCALGYRGGWWYERCHNSNLFGRYSNTSECSVFAECIIWRRWPVDLDSRGNYVYSLRAVDMKIYPSLHY